MEEALGERLLGVHVAHEAGVGRVDEAGLGRIRRHHQHAHPELAQDVAQALPLADGELAVDAAARAPARARVGVGAALHAEVGRVAHQDAAPKRASLTHGRGIPGGSEAGSKPPACSRWAWGKVQ